MPSPADVRRMERIASKVRSRGVKVIWVSGAKSRGAAFSREPVGGITHHDASSTRSGTWGAIGAITHGRGGENPVPGPLSQFQVARGNVPQIAIVACGIANHAGRGGPKIGVPRDSGNAYLYGWEVANNGVGEEYSDATICAISVLAASVLEVIGEDVGQNIGHKEWTTRKIDPTYSMSWMRGLVARVMAGEDDEDMSEVMDFLKEQFRPFVRGDWKRSHRQATLYAYDHAHAANDKCDKIIKAVAANSAALKALSKQHEQIAELPELVAELDAAVDELTNLPLATALVLEEEEDAESPAEA